LKLPKLFTLVSLCSVMMTAASYAADAVIPATAIPAMGSADVFSLIIVALSVATAAVTVIFGKTKQA